MKAPIPILAILLLACHVELHAQPETPKPPKARGQSVRLEGFMAEGGLVNVFTGSQHSLFRHGIAETLKPKQQFDSGDEIQTGGNGYVEVLLNPGNYLRLATNTRVRFVDISPDNFKLELISGSIIVETYVSPLGEFESANSKQTPNDLRNRFDSGYQGISVFTPRGDFVIARGGLYRCDLDAGGAALLKVVKGVAVIPGAVLSDGLATTLGEGAPAIHKIDPAPEDKFDEWSHQRAIALVDANRALRETPWGKQVRKGENYLNIEYDERNERIKEALTVSALGGWVAFAEPGAEYQNADGSRQPLTSGVEMHPGDRVRTNATARVEIHLYPECYLLLNSNSEIVYATRSDVGVGVKVTNGSVMIVSSLKAENGVLTSLITPAGEIEIAEAGVYRLNVRPGHETELVVYKGNAKVDGRMIKENQRAVPGGTGVEPDHARLTDIDPFELWSRKRSQVLMVEQFVSRILRRIPEKRRPAIMPASAHRIRRTGLWYLLPETDTYTFVPAAPERKSPYGLKYELWVRTD